MCFDIATSLVSSGTAFPQAIEAEVIKVLFDIASRSAPECHAVVRISNLRLLRSILSVCALTEAQVGSALMLARH